MIAPTNAQIKHGMIEVILDVKYGLMKCSITRTTTVIEASGNISFFIIVRRLLYSKLNSFFSFLSEIISESVEPIIVEMIAP